MQALVFIMSWTISISFYSLQMTSIDGTTQSMNFYQGKKILIVNIATGSSRASQLARLQQLQERYTDSLVIIGFPSNSFNHEAKSNAEIKQYCQSEYGVTFQLAAKNNVTGLNTQPIYQWLTSQTENGVMNNPVGGDFQKFLINETGELVGVFSPGLDPLNSEITRAISN